MKQLEEELRQQQNGGSQPQGAKKDPNDPSQQAQPDGETTPPPGAQDSKVLPWHASLPPELREFFAGGGLEKLPPRLQRIVRDYQRSLDRQTRPQEGTPR